MNRRWRAVVWSRGPVPRAAADHAQRASRERQGRCLAAACSAALVAALVTAPALAATPTSKQPVLELGDTTLVPGSSVSVHGSGWPQGTTLQAVLCGANAVDGSTDCAESAAATMSPGRDGIIDDQLEVVEPPKPCPCVVVVSALASPLTQRIPVQVVGVPTAPVVTQSPYQQPPALQVTARVTGGSSLATVFGAPAARTLVVTMANASPTLTVSPVMAAGWSRRGGTEQIITTPRLAPLGPGQRRRVSVPFQLTAFSHGTYYVTGSITGSTVPVYFTAQTSTTPWGLLVVAVLLLQLVLLAIRNVFRRRLERRDAAEHAVAKALAVPPIPPSGPGRRVRVVPGPVMVAVAPTAAASDDVLAATPDLASSDEHAAIRWLPPTLDDQRAAGDNGGDHREAGGGPAAGNGDGEPDGELSWRIEQPSST